MPSVNFLFLLALALISWIILCYFKHIEDESFENFDMQMPVEKESPPICDGAFDITFNFVSILGCVYAIGKITQITERYVSECMRKNLNAKKKRENITERGEQEVIDEILLADFKEKCELLSAEVEYWKRKYARAGKALLELQKREEQQAVAQDQHTYAQPTYAQTTYSQQANAQIACASQTYAQQPTHVMPTCETILGLQHVAPKAMCYKRSSAIEPKPKSPELPTVIPLPAPTAPLSQSQSALQLQNSTECKKSLPKATLPYFSIYVGGTKTIINNGDAHDSTQSIRSFFCGQNYNFRPTTYSVLPNVMTAGNQRNGIATT